MPTLMYVRRVWMRPPRTRVWLLRRTTDVSASRLVKRGELMGGGSFWPTSFTSCFTSRETVPCSPMRGVTVRMMPASLYSTAWVMELPVLPPADTGTCWEVTMGTDCETLMTAFLFSLVMMDGLESTLTLFSLASALRAATKSLAATNMLRPGATRVPALMMPGPGGVGVVPVFEPVAVFWVLVMVNLPLRTAHSMPSLVSSVNVTSAASADLPSARRGHARQSRRGRRCRSRNGAGSGSRQRGGAPAPRAPVDRLQGGCEVLGLAVLDEVDEDTLATVDVHVELGHELEDEIHLRLAGVDHQRVGPALRHDERRLIHGSTRDLAAGRANLRRRSRHRRSRRRGDVEPQGRRCGAEPACGEHLVEEHGQLLGIRVADGNDLELVDGHLDVGELEDVEETPDVRRRVGDHDEVGLAVQAHRALTRHEGTQEVHRVLRADVLEAHDLGDELVAGTRRIDFGAHHGADGRLGSALARDDAVHVS